MKLTLNARVGECPICGEFMEHNFDERHHGKHFDTFSCAACEIGVTYASPDDGRGEYHEYNDGEIEVVLEHD